MMFQEDIPVLDRKGLREFGLATGAIVIGLFGLLLPWLWGFGFPLWPWIVGGGLILWALIHPASLKQTYRIWMRIGLTIGHIMSWLLLSAVFYLLISPLGLIMRLLKQRPIADHFDPEADSYRVSSSKPEAKQMERPF